MVGKFSLRAYRARSWIERALRDTSTLDERFIFCWIALNSLYGRPKYLESGPTRTPEQADVNNFLAKVVDGLAPSDLAGIKQYGDNLLREPYLHEGQWKWSPEKVNAVVAREAERARSAWDRGEENEYLKAVFSRLYVLRKQVFHGCATFQSRANRDSLEPAVAVLSRLVPAFSMVVEQQGEAALDLGEPPFKPHEGRSRQGGPDASRQGSEAVSMVVPEKTSAPPIEQWQDLSSTTERCLECIKVAPEAVTRPIRRGEVPDPPPRTRLLSG